MAQTYIQPKAKPRCAKGYTGKRPPKCNEGAGCWECWVKYAKAGAERNAEVLALLRSIDDSLKLLLRRG